MKIPKNIYVFPVRINKDKKGKSRKITGMYWNVVVVADLCKDHYHMLIIIFWTNYQH